MPTDKERLITHLKRWAAKGLKLRRDATHVYSRGEPMLRDMRKVEGGKVSYWSIRTNTWAYFGSTSREWQHYLPLSLLTDDELEEFREDIDAMVTDKERLIHQLKFWSARGFKLRRDATHMNAFGDPRYTDMKKIEGDDMKYWSRRDSAWIIQVHRKAGKRCLPLSLLTGEELAEFYEDA